MPHLNNKRNKNTNPTISRQDYHLTQACPSEEKQTNKETNSAQISIYRKLTQSTGPTLEGKKPKGKKIQPSSRKNSTFLEAWEKEMSSTLCLKKKKAEKYYTMKEPTRSAKYK